MVVGVPFLSLLFSDVSLAFSSFSLWMMEPWFSDTEVVFPATGCDTRLDSPAGSSFWRGPRLFFSTVVRLFFSSFDRDFFSSFERDFFSSFDVLCILSCDRFASPMPSSPVESSSKIAMMVLFTSAHWSGSVMLLWSAAAMRSTRLRRPSTRQTSS